MRRIHYSEGEKIGECVYLRDSEVTKNGTVYIRKSVFKCVCGKEFISNPNAVKNGNTRSCGCLAIAVRRETSHGHAIRNRRSKEHRAWGNMKQRVLNKKLKGYLNYGGRGISICDRWLHSFENFMTDMGPMPAKGYTLERIDNDGNYEPTNCRWATKAQQNRNQTRSRRLTYRGTIKIMAEWAREVGLSKSGFKWRLDHGWTMQEIMSTPSLAQKVL